MITAEQIPEKVVEELHSLVAWIGNSDGAREAIAAALNAWPGVEVRFAPEAVSHRALILPLPKEPRT